MASSAEIRAGPFNFETPRRRLRADATSNHAHFVRNHFDQPNLDLATYCLTIPGGRTVSVAELRELPQQRVTCVLECAGNGRNRMVPRPEGIPWDDEAVGCATWEGPAVRDVLRLAAPDGGAVDVVFRGADSGPEGGAPRAFERSLPVGVAMCDGPILALRMNGRPIPRSHGAPVRLIVPGWYAVASVKWLREIRYINHPFRGYFQTERYVWDDGRPVREVRPRAILLRPPKGPSVKPGVTRLEGRAWASAGVAGVDVQVDDGPWIPARLGNASKRWTWVRWSLDAVLDEGTRAIRVRARDALGREQPLEPVVNRLGYGYNTADEIQIAVRRDRPRIAVVPASWRRARALRNPLPSPESGP